MNATSPKIQPLFKSNPNPNKSSHSALPADEEEEEETLCEIRIRCFKPLDSQMSVFLEYSGENELASYLIAQAQMIIEEQAELE